MTRLSAVLALALAACSTEPVADDAAALPMDQAAPPAALSWNFPGYLIKGTASSITVTGGPATGTAAFAISTAATGAPACPPALAPDCLGIPGPVTIVTTRPFSAGSASFSITVPTTVPLTQVWIQIPGIQGANKFLSPAVRAQLLTPTGDFDGDGVTNIEEALTFGTSPLEADTDSDGLDDGDEIGFGSDPLNEDTDADGLTDGDEFFTYGTDPTDEDSDADGFTDGEEVLNFLTNPLSSDTDADGLGDFEEVVSYFTSPTIADTDADGLSDGEEVIITLTNPLVADTDADGLSDGDEALVYSTNPLSADSDGGGETDGAEVAAGRNPLLASDDFGGGGGVADLVINEVDYDQSGTDAVSFIEIYNAGTAAADLTDVQVRLVNGTGSAQYQNYALATAAASLPPGGYILVANATVVAPPLTPIVVVTGDFLQNGAPDGVALVNGVTFEVYDVLSYEGSITATTLTGFPAPISLVEGTPFAGADTNDNLNSLSRLPNGSDTDDAVIDWTLGTNITPGAANF